MKNGSILFIDGGQGQSTGDRLLIVSLSISIAVVVLENTEGKGAVHVFEGVHKGQDSGVPARGEDLSLIHI